MNRLSENLRERIDECVRYMSEIDEAVFDKAVQKLAYYEDLEEAGRIFVPPVELGKSVWCISKASKIVSQYTVAGYLHDGIRWKVRLTKTIPTWVGNKTEHKYVAVKAFGKTVFLTREEAEKALEGMK